MAKVWHKDTLTKDTLLRLAEKPATLSAAGSSPYFLHRVARQHFDDRATKMIRQRTKKLRELEKRGLINFRLAADDVMHIELSDEGQAWVKKLEIQEQIDKIRFRKPERWGGNWHLVIYNLSRQDKSARNIFRKTLRHWGFTNIQRNVWVSPYECESEIKQLCQILSISKENSIYIETADKKIARLVGWVRKRDS